MEGKKINFRKILKKAIQAKTLNLKSLVKEKTETKSSKERQVILLKFTMLKNITFLYS